MKKFCFIIVLAFIVISCKKENNDQPDPEPEPTTELTIDSKPSFKGIIDGISVNLDESNSVSIQGSQNQIANYPDTSRSSFDSQLASLDYEKGFIMVNIGTLFTPGGGYPDNELFFSFFHVGHVSYSIDHVDGIEVRYWDENNKEWNTSFSGGNQSNSTFTFTDLKEEYVYGNAFMKFKSDLSCTLYDEAGNSMKLTNGVFVNYFNNN